MTKRLSLSIGALILTIFVGALAAQDWIQQNGAMTLRAGNSTVLLIVDQRGTGKIASFRRLGVEVFAIGNTGTSLAPDGACGSTPSYAFTSQPELGLYKFASGVVGLCNATGAALQFGNVAGAAGYGISFGNDVFIARDDAAHALALRSGTTAQRFSVYNTYTSAANHERFSVDWQTTANTALVGCRTAATGTGRACRFGAQASNAGTFSYLEIAANGAATLTGAFTSYNGVAAAGQGVGVIRAQATTGTVTNAGTASIATWTPGAADVEVEVGCRVNITVSTTHSFSCDVTYTDVANNARTRVFPMDPVSGVPLTNGLMTNVVGAGDFASDVIRVGVKASTAITIRTSAGGTFTTVTYTASGTIKQVG